MSSASIHRILVLAANPRNTPSLGLEKEVRQIDEGLRLSDKRDRFELYQQFALRDSDLRRAILRYKPEIIHFCGHGARGQGLVIEDESGQSQVISTDALAGLFELFNDHVRCILLNACYSSVQAEAIHQHIEYVIGMEEAIADEAAITFATGFYDGLGSGRGYEDAFRFGCNAIKLRGLKGDPSPILRQRPDQSVIDNSPNARLLRIIKNYKNDLRDESILQTMETRELPYTDEIVEVQRESDEAKLLELGEKAYRLYLFSFPPHDYKLGLKNYYLIARYLYRAIANNDFSVCRYKPFIYPIHQYLSSKIRASPRAEREELIATLMRWLKSREEVYETARDFAAFELGMCKADMATDVLLDALANINELPLVRYYAAMALGMIRNETATERLIELYCEEKHSEMKKVIAHALINIDAPQKNE